MKQKAEITFEQEETIVLRQAESHLSGFCPRCEANVEFVTPEIFAALTGSSEREIFRLLEAGMLHFVETRRIYACLDCYRRVLTENDGPENAYAKRGELQ